MRAVLQRVDGARVFVEGEEVGRIDGPGILALVAATHTDGEAEVASMVRKIAELRMLHDERSVEDVGGGVLVVSQFTLYGRTSKGRRPSWSDAAPGPVAEPLVDAVAEGLAARGITVATGRFGADMRVELCNDGPFTLVVDV
ncbi:D-aminoacyl-tRNA deacylase [Mobilicoccus pelagius]|uniref:D-aminoacyl-tRNA deacylase n=1 Tax=Mobilicoccus pelagius NBRC 104925 TaxID=1089455 RepID=H5UN51_9MICO|nr:D-aminoacyl-tRNA deacylase [Mobilicoccus pelagius]GAB47159.1 D-tyrosyl-tRNA(Tyr) deacylase [Mobilicoccus pelagius NBRC 104925]